MARQVGAVVGVAILVVIIGAPRGLLAVQRVFHHAWYAMAAAELVTAAASALIPRSQGMSQGMRPGRGRQGADSAREPQPVPR